MATTISLTRAWRHANEAGLTGVESDSVNGVLHLNQIISSGTEEAIAGGVGFTAERMQALGLLCDGDVAAQFLGVQYGIASITGAAGGPIVSDLDLTALLFAGDYIRVRGSTGGDNDGIFQVLAVGAAPNNIDLELGHLAVAQVGAGGTLQKIMSARLYNLTYEIATTVPPLTFTYAGNVTDIFLAGDYLQMTDTAAGVNDGIYRITSSTFGAGVTTIIVEQAGPDGGPDVLGVSGAGVGEFQKFSPAFVLAENVPLIWSIKGGTNNPLQDVVNTTDFPLQGVNAEVLVNNAGAENVTFQGRVATDAVL